MVEKLRIVISFSLIGLLLATPCYSAIEIKSGSVHKGYVNIINFTKAISADTAGITATVYKGRVLSLSNNSATPAVNTDLYDVVHITAQAQAITSMTTSLSGSGQSEGDTLAIDITDDGTSRAITWGTSWEASGGVALPAATVIGVRLDMVFRWNSVTTKWRIVGSS